VVVDGGELWVDTSAGRLRLPPLGSRVADGAPVVIGVRPEDLHRADGPIAATVRAVEWLGPERHILCDVAGTMVTIREPAEKRDPEPGEALGIGCEPVNVHVFDGQSTERLT
jgi:ABC-type sugar transport system ATPase subunit